MLSISQSSTNDEFQASIQREASTSHSSTSSNLGSSEGEHSPPTDNRNNTPAVSSFAPRDGTNTHFSSAEPAKPPPLPDSPRRGSDQPLSLINAFFGMVEMGRVEGFRHIFQRMKRLNQLNITREAGQWTHIEGRTVLMQACRFIQPEIVRILLEESDDKLNVHECDINGWNALMVAVHAYIRLSPDDGANRQNVMYIINQLLNKNVSFLEVSSGGWSIFSMLLSIKDIAQYSEIIDYFVNEFYHFILDILEQDCSQFCNLIQDLHDPEKSKKLYSLYTEAEIEGYKSCFENCMVEIIDDDEVAGNYGDALKQLMLAHCYSYLLAKPRAVNTPTSSSSNDARNDSRNDACSSSAAGESALNRQKWAELAQRQIKTLSEIDQLTTRMNNIQAHLKNLQNNDPPLLWDYRNPAPLLPTESVTALSFMRNRCK